MSKANAIPFHRAGNSVLNSHGKEVCTCVGLLEAKNVTDALNLWGSGPSEKVPTPEHPPTPNQAETDAVAVKYYESGRTLEVQAWVVGDWTDQPEPNFSSRYPWRINPAKRRVVVEIYKTPSGGMSSMLKDFETAPSIFTLLGTIEGEVEL